MAIKNKAEKMRFAVVGSCNTIIDFGLLFILKYLGLPVVAANTISTSCAFIFSFFANKKYTFKHQEKSTRKQFFMFVGVTLFGLWVVQNGLITLMHPLASHYIKESALSLLATKAIASFVTLVWNYIMYSRVIFPNTDVDEVGF